MKLKETVEDVYTRIQLLDEDARTALFVTIQQLVAVLESEEGCAVAFADPKGDGHLSVIAIGNQELVTPILEAAAELHSTIATAQEGPIQ